MDMKKLLETVTKFAGQAVGQKPGDQWRGDDPNPPGKKLVGDSILKDLSKGPKAKTLEEELAEAFAQFNEDDLGVEPKRPSRKGSRPSRPYTKHGKPSKRYTPVKEGWGGSGDRVHLPSEPDNYYHGKGQLSKEYNELYNKLVPSMGAADTIEGEVLRAASKIVYRHYNDGDEFNAASFSQLEPYIGKVTSYDDLAHKATVFALAAEGEYHPNTGWDSLDVMEYGPEFDDDDYDDEDEYWDEPEDEDDLEESDKEEFRSTYQKFNDKVKHQKEKSINWPKEVPSDASQERNDDEDEPHPYGHDLEESEKEEFKSTYKKYYEKVKQQKEKSQTKEGWESGPEERSSRERDPDAEYDAMRQEKADAEAQAAQAKRPQQKVYTLTGRGPNMEPNYKFPGEYASQAEADAARTKLMADPKTPNPRMIGISTRTKYLDEHGDQKGYDPRGQNPFLKPGQKALKGKQLSRDEAGKLAQDAFNSAFGGNARELTKNLKVREGIESKDPIEGAVLRAVQDLIQQGHTDVAPEVVTNMVVAATGKPFLLKDLVDANKNSPAIQHYIDSINPTKVKFSNDILTVKNENPARAKAKSQSGVSSMAARAANRPRLGENSVTPLRDREDYIAKRKALQDIQTDADTHKDPELKGELARRMGILMRQAKELGIDESRAHKVLNTWFKNRELQDKFAKGELNTPIAQPKAKVQPPKKQVKEYGADQPSGTAGQSALSQTNKVDPKQAAAVAQATQALKSATQSVAPAPMIAKALDAASQGKPVGQQDMKALEPLMKDVATVAQEPKLAGQFKSLAQQIQQVQQKQQKKV